MLAWPRWVSAGRYPPDELSVANIDDGYPADLLAELLRRAGEELVDGSWHRRIYGGWRGARHRAAWPQTREPGRGFHGFDAPPGARP